MLDCGYASPFKPVETFPGGSRTDEQIAQSMLCVERSGYSHYLDGNLTPVCTGWKAKAAACQPGSVVVTPDPTVRLNSGYCKKYPQSRACVP